MTRTMKINNNNNMNGILLNNSTQTSHIPHTLIQLVIPGTTV